MGVNGVSESSSFCRQEDHRLTEDARSAICKTILSPGDLQQITEIPIIPVEPISQGHSYFAESCLVPPWECFIGACGVKAKPDCSDIVHILIKDPKEFLKKAGAEGDPEKYLVELCGIVVGYEGLSEEDKKRMKNVPIFVGYCTSRSSDPEHSAIVVRDKFQLIQASKILLANDMENRWILSGWLHRMSCSKWTCCEEVRKVILEKLPIFMHEFDEQRLKQGLVHRKWDDKSRMLVKGHRDLRVNKKLESNYHISAEHQRESNEFFVSAEITTEENGCVVLWLKKTEHLDMYDVAVTLCRLLFKTHKKHNMDKEVLRKRGYDVDRIEQAHEAAKLEDKKKEEDDMVKELMDQCAKGQATQEEQEIRNKEHSGADKKRKDVKYCAELKSTALETVDVGGAAGLIPVWRQKDPDLMGFNRHRLIFLNLAHYTEYLDSMTPGQAYIHWYYIILHEIAHNKTPFHDKNHELLVAGLSAHFLRCGRSLEVFQLSTATNGWV
ncbi:hypothetical protein BD769DRAFT_1640377 [Suillus cothurnatus]|nr:hypothetical protein BD769DRAFT_1640377 [Suillus cothurnatus]